MNKNTCEHTKKHSSNHGEAEVLRGNIIKWHSNGKADQSCSKDLKRPCQYNWFDNLQVESSQNLK